MHTRKFVCFLNTETTVIIREEKEFLQVIKSRNKINSGLKKKF